MTDYGADDGKSGIEDYDGGAGFETWDCGDVRDDADAQTGCCADSAGGGSNVARGVYDACDAYADLRPTITRP